MNIQTQYSYEKTWRRTNEQDLLKIIEEEVGDADPAGTLKYIKEAVKTGKVITVGVAGLKRSEKMTNDIARLILRVTVGFMILFHGFDKVINGIGGVKHLVGSTGAPEFLAYGIYVGEIVVPILILLGAYARVASLVLAFNMLAAIFLAYGSSLFSLGKHGAPVFELPFLYFVMSILIFMLGSGKYALNGK